MHTSESDADLTASTEELSELQASWSNTSSRERGRKLKELVEQGWKKRELARELGCSESLIRQFIDIAVVEESDPEGSSYSDREKVRLARSRRARAKQVHPSVRDRKVEQIDFTGVLFAWVRKNIPKSFRLQFLEEIRSGMHRYRAFPFVRTSAQDEGRTIDMTPSQIIEDSKPSGLDPNGMPEWFNYCVDWYLCWATRLIGDHSVMYDTVCKVENLCRQE